MPNMEDTSLGGTSGVTMMNNFYFVDAVFVDEDSTHDLALLRMDPNLFQTELPTFIKIGEIEIKANPKVATLRIERPRDGTPVAVSGHLLLHDALVTNAGCRHQSRPRSPGDRQAHRCSHR